MDLSLTTETYGAEDQTWLGSAHATDTGRTITIDTETLDTEDHYRHGWIPSGLPVGMVTASGLYGPYDPQAEDGREVLAGFVLASVPGPKESGNPVGASLLDHGRVITGRLPVELDDVDHAQRCVAGRIVFADHPALGPVTVDGGES